MNNAYFLKRIDESSTTTNTNLGTLETDVETINTTLTTTNGKLDTINTSLGPIDTNTSNTATKLDTVNTNLGTIETDIETTNTKLDTIISNTGTSSNTYYSENLKIDGTGATNLNGDYSSVNKDAYYTATNDDTSVNRILIYLQDTGTFDVSNYTASAALATGIKFYYKVNSGAGKVYLNNDLPITNVGEYSCLCYDVASLNFGTGDDAIAVRWTFTNAGVPIVIDNTGQFGVELKDDLSGLNNHCMIIQGNYP